jgi:hypothetical protein
MLEAVTNRGRTVSLEEYRWIFGWVKPSWYQLALCGKPGYKVYTKTGAETIWFSHNNKDRELATQVCRHCPVRWACLCENLEARAGVFGGTNPNQRKKLNSKVLIRTPSVVQSVAEELGY